MAQGGEQSASLTMNPPDLGPMQVVLSVSNNQATVEFMAAQPEVRQALEAALPRLRDMMSESGIQLGQANVSAGGQQQFAGSDGGGRSGGRGNDHAGAEAPQVRQGMVRIARDGTVDTFA
jgi:flagellar hook-length control protein FliK